MKNFKTHIYVSFFFLGQYLRKRKIKVTISKWEYADNKFVDAEANYRVSNSIQIVVLQLRKRYLQKNQASEINCLQSN
jgi:hypothetical protein